MDDFRISVVIPVFNRPVMVRTAIASVLAQSFAADEIIIVDDGSTDDTVSVIEQVASGDPRIRLVRQTNAGANAARNNGVDNASGDWIAFLDSDDHWHSEKLAAQVSALRSNPRAVASFTGITAVNDGRELYDYDTPPQVSLLDIRRHNMLGSTSTVLVKTDILRKVGCFDPLLLSCQDWDLWIRLRLAGEFAIVRKPMLYYEEGGHDRISSNVGKALAGHREILKKALAGVASPNDRRVIRASHLEVTSRLMKRHGMRLQAARSALLSLALSPSRAAAKAFRRSFS